MTEYCDVDLRKWSVLDSVDDKILQKVVLVQVFGFDAESAFFVTSHDNVYAVGKNVYGRLGVPYRLDNDIGEPAQIDELSGKEVTCFTTGSITAAALTKNGEVYIWGGNIYGQIGNGCTNEQPTPIKINFPQNEKIKEVSLADRYVLALSVDSKLYHWGDIKWDCSQPYKLAPTLLEPKGEHLVTSICCGAHHAAAVTNKGQVLTWGVNDFGQLGSGNVEIVEIPKQVGGQLEDLFIVEVTCSYRATLALSKNGNLYAWGYNENSSLAVGSPQEAVHFPQRVIFMNNIRHIASNNLLNGLCAEGAANEIYFWASDKDDEMSPGTTKYSTILDAFFGRAMPKVIRNDKCAIVESSSPQGPTRDLGKALFNKKELSDLTIILVDGEVYVHTLILRAFSEHFKTLLDENWSQGKNVIDMTQYNPRAYRALLKYVYTGNLDRLEGPEIIALSDIAVSYFENELKNLCAKMFYKRLTIANVAQLYKMAVGHNSELVDSCVLFTSKVLESVILSEGFEQLEPFLSKSLILSAARLKNIPRM